MNDKRVPPEISTALSAGAGVIVPTSQRQASLRAAWAEEQRAAGRKVWGTPRIVTLTQLAESLVRDQHAIDGIPDGLLPSEAEWAQIRELRRDAGGIAETRALLAAVRTTAEWNIPTSAASLGASPEAELFSSTLRDLRSLATRERRKPLREWLGSLTSPPGKWIAAGFGALPPVPAAALERIGATVVSRAVSPRCPVSITTAETDDHELELIAGWCRAHLEQDPGRRLLIVDARVRARRRAYERVLSQALTPGEWIASEARRFSTVFAIEGGQPLTDFPLIAHALLSLRLLTSRLTFNDIVRWLRLPFRDASDVFGGAAIEAALREGRQLDYDAADLAAFLEAPGRGAAAATLAAQLRRSLELLAGERRSPAEWSSHLLAALRATGWHGTRVLRSDEQQTVARWQALLDEYSALGSWLPRSTAASAVETLSDLAAERSFDPASVAAPITLTDSHDDPLVRFDGIWVAGLDAAQWPPPPRADVFIPLRLQNAAGIPLASAAGQTRLAHRSLDDWRGSTGQLVCSWGRLDGDAHRSVSPLLARLETSPYDGQIAKPLAELLRTESLELLDDSQGPPIDRTRIVAGGVRPLTLQAECGFRAYADVRLKARELETPAPGIDPRDRGMLLHKALELVWLQLANTLGLKQATETRSLLINTIAPMVDESIVYVFGGRIPVELTHAISRERMRTERLIESLLMKELERSEFSVAAVESLREVQIAGGAFSFRIDRIDNVEGGGCAILDYKSGEPRTLRWNSDRLRDPQLIAYLLAERGRDVQALANVFLAGDRAKFAGRSARSRMLPGIKGLAADKIPADQIDAAWQADVAEWIDALQGIASDYLAGRAPVEPAPDVCRNCDLTILCRRLELEDMPDETFEGGDE
ncbi:MAG: PD-(D/E)XK nuclease family protein [Steroidobacteraceae bacterium]|nr:PD-(D/E)XK nuclease family protein [Steroidobacteraceae bacterium]